MKGLMIKDLKLIASRNSTIIFLAVALLVVSVFVDNPEPMIGYMCLVCTLLVLGTISYDEFENGYAFLMTLPVTRKVYVQSKYVFSIAYSVAVFVIAAIVTMIIGAVKGVGIDLASIVGLSAGSLLFLCIMVPVELKFGVEKSRIAMAVIVGLIGAVFTAMVMISTKFEIFPEDYDELITNAMNNNSALIFIGMAVAAVVMVGISYMISVRVMEKKEL